MSHKDEKFQELFGGGEKGKPHSTRAGRIAAGKRRIKRIVEKQRPKILDRAFPTTARDSAADGGRATRGYGKAYMKGGRVK